MDTYSLAVETFLTDEERQFRDSVRRFMKQEVEPLVPQMEAEGQPPAGLLEKMGDAGMLGTFLPEEYGGAGASLMTRAIVAEETARMSAGLDATLFVNIGIVARHLSIYGTHEQKEKYLRPLAQGKISASICITEPHGGSNALSPRTTARKDGDHWIIKGHKTYITNAPIAEFFLVFTRTSGADRNVKGGTCFIVERSTPGLSTGKPFDKLCLRASPTSEVFLEDVRVHESQVLGKVDEGFRILLDGLDSERVFEGASNTGIGQACLDVAIPYALEREVFGQPIATYQMIQDKIAQMATGVETSRTMFYHLIRACERGINVNREAAMLKLYSSEMAVQASRDAVQILGGNGLMEEYPAARLYRDAKHHEIGAGTSEIQKLIIAKETLRQYRQVA
ncbi:MULTISPECIES: acyl-CoA dehydrogenase family protein [unclassified Sphingomonas]|uniref:acyl-CoA dehydrogenase family protein n=1 Tax=unclassified Sphingomonas TaxID=196159 RepID=UPI0006F7CB1B|nr:MULTISPECIES: acyl-CoA dehydrogenase family protein [unclassified Sphingomonas]KQX23219.1 acyl-CoA dehydrogenase [Sphingomonas sp. Root1294]KQY68067.1 acyl-CoA dehydrogenase [Sphingomonas sp. Root50]KRB90958.1 acyl-CoA dehydrogenase [Sphingomonas sp. Root720]